jgi:ribosome-associated protein
MKQKEFKITGEYIELIKLLKLLGLAESGSHAKYKVEAGEVKLNGTAEYRKRAKLRKGDIVEVLDWRIKIVNT